MAINTNYQASNNNNTNSTPVLHNAITLSGRITGVADSILKNQIDQLYQGETPLTLAILFGLDEIVDQLLRKGADPLLPDSSKKTPLELAKKSGNQKMIKRLEEATRISLKRKFEEEVTPVPPLHWAASEGRTETLRSLIRRRATVDFLNKKDMTALYMAAKNGHGDSVKILLDAKADIDRKNGIIQETALHIAAVNNNAATVEVLLKRGANPFLTDVNGKTAKDVTTDSSIQSMIATAQIQTQSEDQFHQQFAGELDVIHTLPQELLESLTRDPIPEFSDHPKDPI